MRRYMTRTLMTSIVLVAAVWAGAASDTPRPGAPADMMDGYRSGVIGGPHDFTTVGGDACSACHIPHIQAIVPTTQPTATQPAVAMFRIAGQRRVFVTNRYTPGPTSLICLSCHDGTVSTSTIGASHSMLAGVREGFAVPEGFVWRDHPIGVPYPIAPRDYHPAAFVIKQKMRLPDGRIECVSCHDPHNVAGVKHLLWTSNRRSALCLTCHIK
jgi:predicted CXXCH cytochrome family protein